MAAVLRGDAVEYVARVRACEEAKRVARVARGKVELASRYDGSYECARQAAKLAGTPCSRYPRPDPNPNPNPNPDPDPY